MDRIMELTEQDREALFKIWMSQKAKMRLTQMEMAKKMGMPQQQFSQILQGGELLTKEFVRKMCRIIKIKPELYIPSFQSSLAQGDQVIHLRNVVQVDGDIQNVIVDGNNVIIEYAYSNC